MSPGQVLLLVLGLALTASVGANAWLFHERDKVLEARATITQLQADTREAANTCKSSVDELGKKTLAQGARIQQDVAAIAPRVGALQKESILALQARPDDPKDLCGSLERFFRRQAGGAP